MAAYTCVLHAERSGSPGALIERAKLLWQTGKREAALACLDEGLKCVETTANLIETLAMPPPNPKRGTRDPAEKPQEKTHTYAQQVSLTTWPNGFFLCAVDAQNTSLIVGTPRLR